MSTFDLIEKIWNAGVVGAGGAGFPTHIKLQNRVETLLVNAAECEPLITKDRELMKLCAPQIAEGLRLLRQWLDAKNVIIGIKSKNKDEINSLKKNVGADINFCLMKDVYPAGDEFVLVYEATGKLIPPAGIPLDIGCVVVNVETLYNISLAAMDIPVTQKFITVAGAVRNPSTFQIPVGISFADCIRLAGGATAGNIVCLVGGAMMGELSTDLSAPVTKTTAGLIVLPNDHQLIKRRLLPPVAVRRIGASACDQCYRCTELCPRWLLGYEIVPHEVMRSLLFSAGGARTQHDKKALLCIECNICSLYACPEDLDPKSICADSKRELLSQGIRPDKNRKLRPNPIRDSRQVPTSLLTRKLGLAQYDSSAPFKNIEFSPDIVRIPLRQHLGNAATSIVNPGERVGKGQLIGDISLDRMGAKVHSSIDGIIESVDSCVTIRKSQ